MGPKEFKGLMNYLTRPSDDKKRQKGYFETNDPKEAAREVIRRVVPIDQYTFPITNSLNLGLGPDLDQVNIGSELDVGGGTLSVGGGMKGDEKAFGIGFRKEFEDGGRIGFQKAGFVISSNKQKTKLNFTKKQDALAKKVYGKSMKELYKTNRNLFHNIRFDRVKETTQAGKGAKVEGNIQIPTKDVRQPDGTVKKIELPVRYPNKKIEKEFKKAVRNIFKFTPNAIPYSTLAENFPITERQAVRAAKQIKKEEGLEYAKGKTTQEYTKEVRNPLLDKTSSRQVEKRMGLEKQRLLADQPEFKGKIDIAHRASKSHMARLGLEFDTRTVGMDSRLINQVVLKPSENMLEKLYTKREKILDNIKGKPTDEQKKTLKEINNSVKKVVKTTSGRFVGILVDPNNLEPSFTGIRKDLAFSKVGKTMKDIAKLPGTPDALGAGYTKDSEYFKFIRDNVQKSVSGEINRGFVPNDFKVILSDSKNRKSLLDYAKKNTPDIYSQFKKILSNPFSKQRFAVYSNLPAAAIPAGIVMSLANTAKKKGIGFDQEFEQTADLTGGAIVPKGLSKTEQIAAGTTGAALGLTKPVQTAMSKVLTPLTVPLIGLDLYNRAQAMKDTAKNITAMKPGVQQDRAVEDFAVGDYRGYGMAGGGIAGVKSGPPPESGPTPHGLPSLMKRGMKI